MRAVQQPVAERAARVDGVQDAERRLARIGGQRRAVDRGSHGGTVLAERRARAMLGCVGPAVRVSRPVVRLRRSPGVPGRGALAVAAPAHVRALRIDRTRTIDRAGLVATLVAERGTLGARTLGARALGATAREARAIRGRALGAGALETRPPRVRVLCTGPLETRSLGALDPRTLAVRPIAARPVEAGSLGALEATPLTLRALDALEPRALDARPLGTLALGAALEAGALRSRGRRATAIAARRRTVGARTKALAAFVTRPETLATIVAWLEALAPVRTRP